MFLRIHQFQILHLHRKDLPTVQLSRRPTFLRKETWYPDVVGHSSRATLTSAHLLHNHSLARETSNDLYETTCILASSTSAGAGSEQCEIEIPHEVQKVSTSSWTWSHLGSIAAWIKATLRTLPSLANDLCFLYSLHSTLAFFCSHKSILCLPDDPCFIYHSAIGTAMLQNVS